MKLEVRVYVEGGGDGAMGRASMKSGFRRFFHRVLGEAGPPEVIACGGRGDAFKNFKTALRQHRDALNLLLVDSEGPVSAGPWEHLASSDGWTRPDAVLDHQCHLMVQVMEAWLVVDTDALQEFYGEGFDPTQLPPPEGIEQVRKKKLYNSLRLATAGTAARRYRKLLHGALLLTLVDPEKVSSHAPHAERLFRTLAGLLEAGGRHSET